MPEKRSATFTPDESNHLEITGTKPLSNFSLLQYAENRFIPKEIIQNFYSEVNYCNGGKNYFAVGFKNDLGGIGFTPLEFKGVGNG